MVDAVQSVSVEEHLSQILEAVAPLTAVDAPLSDAHGRVLAGDVRAEIDVPGFDNSAMDGYAVRKADVAGASDAVPVTLRVVADLPAGTGENPALPAGTAARIMTGAPLPADADAVIPVEETDGGIDTVLVRGDGTGRDHIRGTGADVHAGDAVLEAGKVLSSRDLAAAAAIGHSSLPVHPAPRVAVVSTGSELVPPGGPLGRGRIHDSNSYLLEAAVVEAGGVPVRIAAVPDDEDLLRSVFERHAGEVDAFVTSGGVSVGAYDVVKAVLQPLGSVRFQPVRMQPGKPQGFGRWSDGTPIFALPGNPVSVFVSFETFVRPALRRMQGLTDLERPTIPAVAAEGWRSPAGRAQYMPIVVARDRAAQEHDGASSPTRTARSEGGPLHVRPAARGGSASHLVASLSHAEGIAIVDENVTEVGAGETVPVRLVNS